MTGLMVQPTRRPAFWVAYVTVAAICMALAWQLFPQAIPLVNLDIRLSRNEAVAKAQALAAERKLVAADARSAARFRNDQAAQNYVELEGGGKPAFVAMVEGTTYAPFWWEVRLFKPGEVEEVLVQFRPDGAINGFARRLPETYVRDASRKALEPAAAIELARTVAARDWNVDFGAYHFLEQSQETQPSGRVDHQFVFERDEKIGEAQVRVQLAVVGDELTAVTRYVHVPEKFERRFAEMRSANAAAIGAMVGVTVVMASASAASTSTPASATAISSSGSRPATACACAPSMSAPTDLA